jgi:hypothetical protein
MSTHTAHELAALAEQGMKLTDQEAAAVSAARKGQDMSDIVEDLRRTIEALRTQLQAVLDRESVTTARHDARIAVLEAELLRLNRDIDGFTQEARDEGYREGQLDCEGALRDFWRWMLAHLEKKGVEPADDGEGSTAQQMMDAVHEAEHEANARAEALEAENARLRAVNSELAQFIMDKAPATCEADDWDGVLEIASDALKETK